MSTREEIVVIAVVAALTHEVKRVVGGVATAELVLSWGGRRGGVAVVGVAVAVVMVVEHEVA